jgi:hypothetical protein
MEDEDSKILFLRQPDRLERWIRLICGGLLGLVMGGWLSLRLELPWVLGAAGTVVLAVVFGLLARKYGDHFWYEILESWNWPRRRR